MIVTTVNEVSGHSIVQYHTVLSGILVRSTTIAQGFLGGLKQVVGVNIESYAKVCESDANRLLTVWFSILLKSGLMQ